MAKRKVKAKNLKSPLWQDIIYMLLIMVAPIVITCIELFQSHSSFFKISFASVGVLLVTYIIIKKYVLNGRISKLRQEITQLEHDYAINAGDENLTVVRWKNCQLKVYLYNAITVVLAMILMYLFITALAEGLIAFRGAAMLVLSFVFLGMVFKVCTYIRGVYIEFDDGDDEVDSNEIH